MKKLKTKRIRWSIAVSVGVHIAVFTAFLGIPKGHFNALLLPVQIEITSSPTKNITERNPHSTATPATASPITQNHSSEALAAFPPNKAVDSKFRNHRRHLVNTSKAQRTTRKDELSSSAVAHSDASLPQTNDPITDIVSNPPPKKITAPATVKPALRTQMSFSDYEAFAGKTAEQEKDAYQQKTQAKRRRRQPLVPLSAKLQKALRNRRSVLTDANTNVLPDGKKTLLITTYLQTVHKTLSPKFATFLNTLDSFSERMHKKVQNSPLKYNPFYVPPPDPEREQSLNGPMNDLSIHAIAEFEIMPDGALGDVRLVRSSKHTVFDAAAIDAVIQSAPFVPPPPSLLSRNNRSYLRWTFQRDWKKNTWSQGHIYLLAPDSDTEADLELPQ